jgi:phage-related protein
MDTKWNIILYEKSNRDCPVLTFIQSLPAKHRAKLKREIDLLEEFGINLAYPHTKKVQGDQYKGLWELRVKFASDIARVFYFLHLHDTFVLLHGFTKKSDDTPIRELERAKNYMIDFIQRRDDI